VTGYLADVHALESRPELRASTERLSTGVAADRLKSDVPPQIVDVRTPHEYETKRIDGSVSLPLSRLAQLAAELPRDRPLLVHCAGGYRSSIAASLLQQAGFDRVSELAGGIAAWEAAGLPVSSAGA
jgi:rhodanese-related sulfurtransferase